jgi:hypothetical protein
MAGGLNGPPVTSGGAYAYPTKTLAQLRTDILIRLGFISRISNFPTKTRLQLRQDVIDTLGLPDPISSAQTRTLDALRQEIYDRLGHASMSTVGGLAPGMADLIDSFINTAQATLWRRLELDNGGSSAPALMTADGDTTTLDWVPIFNLALGLAKAHEGQPDSKVYVDIHEQWVVDQVRRRPPNLDEIINTMLEEAQATVFRRYELGQTTYTLTAFTDDAHSTSIDYHPVFAQATAMAKARFEQKDAKLYVDMVEKYFNDLMRRKPPEATDLVTQVLQDAQQQVYRQYKMMRHERWWSWDTVAGERFYDVPKDGTDFLDFGKISGVWLEDASGNWLPMRQKIDPLEFSSPDQSMPYAYELREYLEVWPEPDGVYTIWLKGNLGLRAFADDADVTTVDPQAVFLKALAMAKGHYRQPDANAIMGEFERYIGNLNAESYTGARFIPHGWGNRCSNDYNPRGRDYGPGVRWVDTPGIRGIE